jgi:hypothetical protein
MCQVGCKQTGLAFNIRHICPFCRLMTFFKHNRLSGIFGVDEAFRRARFTQARSWWASSGRAGACNSRHYRRCVVLGCCKSEACALGSVLSAGLVPVGTQSPATLGQRSGCLFRSRGRVEVRLQQRSGEAFAVVSAAVVKSRSCCTGAGLCLRNARSIGSCFY